MTICKLDYRSIGVSIVAVLDVLQRSFGKISVLDFFVLQLSKRQQMFLGGIIKEVDLTGRKLNHKSVEVSTDALPEFLWNFEEPIELLVSFSVNTFKAPSTSAEDLREHQLNLIDLASNEY